MPVERKTREVYYSQRRGRHFLTARGAALAEANARMYKVFPSEKAEYDEANYYQMIYPAWSFHEVPRLVAIRDRLVKRYLKALR